MRTNIPDHYFYKCSSCSREYSARQIEEQPVYLCPDCGSANKNEPLRGVLTLEYDYESLQRKINRDHFLQLRPGAFWLYPDLWPLKTIADRLSGIEESVLQKLALPDNPVLDFSYRSQTIQVFDDTRNPTYSFKDRATALVLLKAIQNGIREIALASTGNAGSSLAGLCARLGLKAHVFVPEQIPAAKRLQIQSYGAALYLVEGTYDTAFDLCLEVSAAKGWYNRNTAYNPLTIEGKKWAAYDIFLATKGCLPDIIMVPVGDGVILGGLYKGFRELLELGWIERLPVFIAAQAAGSDAMVRYMEAEAFEFKPATTIADSIHAAAPRNLFMAADALRKSGGKAVAVTDEQIITAQKQAAVKMGMFIEPAAAASLAAYDRLFDEGQIRQDKLVMLMFTGSALKDQAALERWNQPVAAKSVDTWRELFKQTDRKRK